MSFSDSEIDQMKTILDRLENGVPISIQFHLPESLNRTGFVFGVRNKKGKYICLYRNYRNLSKYRLKLLQKLAQKVKYKLNITHPTDDLTCVGWKYDK